MSRYPAGHGEGYGEAFRNLFASVYRAIARQVHEPVPDVRATATAESRRVEAAVASARDRRLGTGLDVAAGGPWRLSAGPFLAFHSAVVSTTCYG